MYKQFAKYYDSIYKWKDYKAESEKIVALIKEFKTSRGKEMLDVACGTGSHIQYLKRYFNITGVDLDKDMLGIARKKFPDVKFIRGDMRNFKLNKQFDVIVCLFSAIGHLRTYANLGKTIKNFAKHLKQGGVMIVEPFVSEEQFMEGFLHADYVREPDLKLVRMVISKKRGSIGFLDFHFLVGEKGKIKYFVDRQYLGMFNKKKVLSMVKNTGLNAEFLKDGLMKNRGLYIGIKK
jgi:ubiquinone/menaquinone biosynthesis C-methylase UbiE